MFNNLNGNNERNQVSIYKNLIKLIKENNGCLNGIYPEHLIDLSTLRKLIETKELEFNLDEHELNYLRSIEADFEFISRSSWLTILLQVKI